MKHFIVLILLIKSFALYSQNKDTLINYNRQVAQTSDGKVKAFLQDNQVGNLYLIIPHQKDEWLDRALNNKNEWDTIAIGNFTKQPIYEDVANHTFYSLDSCTLEYLQIDSIGLNAIVISQTITGREHCIGETFDFIRFEKQKLILIWNLDNSYGKQQKLFSAKPFYSEHSRNANDYPFVLLSDRKHEQIDKEKVIQSIVYSYEFKVKKNGDISIENMVEKKKNALIQPDHKEGLYKYKGGQYVLTVK
jgi:hypothetical protein